MDEKPRVSIRYDHTRHSMLAENCVLDKLCIAFCSYLFSERCKMDNFWQIILTTAMAVDPKEKRIYMQGSIVIWSLLCEGIGSGWIRLGGFFMMAFDALTNRTCSHIVVNVTPYSLPSKLNTGKLLCATNTDMSYNGIIMIFLNWSLL